MSRLTSFVRNWVLIWPPKQWPLLIVLLSIVVSLSVVLLDSFRPGTIMFASSVLLAAVFRLVLPARQAGLLVLRRRMFDVVTLTVLGVIILTLAILVPDLPPGGLPAQTR